MKILAFTIGAIFFVTTAPSAFAAGTPPAPEKAAVHEAKLALHTAKEAKHEADAKRHEAQKDRRDDKHKAYQEKKHERKDRH